LSVAEIISDVATEYNVSADELEKRAEASWGAPLETDKERNASHFEFIEKKPEIARRAREATRKLWELAKPAYRQNAAMLKRCRQEFESALERSDIQHLGHRAYALSVFEEEIERLMKLESDVPK
jgi:hypothetical protein